MALVDSGAHPLALGQFEGAPPLSRPPSSEPSMSPPEEDSRPSSSPPPEPRASTGACTPPELQVAHLRLTGLVRLHYGFLWRSLRRLGVREADVDDAAQRVLQVVARRLPSIEPRAEKSFLFQTALRVASEFRRANGRARAVPDEDALARAADDRPTPEEELHKKQARAELDAVLDQMSLDLRAVFVLFELEGMSTNEIAAMLAIPAGTVSSRLSRARAEFQELAARVRAARLHPAPRRRP